MVGILSLLMGTLFTLEYWLEGRLSSYLVEQQKDYM